MNKTKKATEIELPCYGILVTLSGDGGGAITSELHEGEEDAESDDDPIEAEKYYAAIDGLESFILAQAVAGIDIESKQYIQAIRSAVAAIGNNY